MKAIEPVSRKLGETLRDVYYGRLALPYFQREFEWSMAQMRKLLASVFVGLPIGSILVLTSDKNEGHKFVARQIEGTKERPATNADYLLDGQQRITSLYSMFHNIDSETTTKSRLTARWFVDASLFIDLRKENWQLLENNSWEPEEIETYFQWESRSARKPIMNAESDTEFRRECVNQNLIPLDYFWSPDEGEGQHPFLSNLLHNIGLKKLLERLVDEEEIPALLDESDDEGESVYQRLRRRDITALNAWIVNVTRYVTDIMERVIIPALVFPVSDFDRAIQAFEILNSSGTKLHAFDLLVAKAGRVRADYSVEDSVDEDEEDQQNKPAENFVQTINQYLDPQQRGALQVPESIKTSNTSEPPEWSVTRAGIVTGTKSKDVKNHIVNALTLIGSMRDSSAEVWIKNSYYFNMTVSVAAERLNLVKHEAMERLIRSIAFLQYRCGLPSIDGLPYKLIVLPLVSVMDEATWTDRQKINLLEAWFWTVTLTGRYMTNQSEVTVREINRLKELLSGSESFADEEPSTMHFEQGALDLLNVQHILSVPRGFEDEGGRFRRKLDLETLEATSDSDSIYKVIMLFFRRIGLPDLLVPSTRVTPFIRADVEDHHLLPLGSLRTIGATAKKLRKNREDFFNSIFNRTLVTKDTNRKLSDLHFGSYVSQIDQAALEKHFLSAGGGTHSLASLDPVGGQQTYVQTAEALLRSRGKRIRAEIVGHVRSLL